MFHVDNLTGHVRMRPRQELARTVRYVAEKIGLATPTKDGLMSATDKAKLDGLGLATRTKLGLMSAADKVKLDDLDGLDRLGEIEINIECSADGLGYPSDFYTDERYIWLYFYGVTNSEIGYTCDLSDFDEAGLTNIVRYFHIVNDSDCDINIVVSGWLYAPADTVVKAGCVREASLYRSDSGKIVLTMSDNLELY